MQDNDIIKALNWRYAVKVFDTSKKVSEENFKTILESARLAPSPFGIEAWKFIVVENPELRKQLRAVSYDQPKITEASHVLVVARRTDVKERITAELIQRTARQQGVAEASLEGLKGMVEGTMGYKSPEEIDAWVRGHSYIPLGMMIETAALLGVDAGPMEGFEPAKVDELLGLPAMNLKSTTMIAFGYRGEDPAAGRPKVRRDFDDAFLFLR